MRKVITNPLELTPVENIDGLWVKREDLFAPFGLGNVNGGKLRQCWLLVESIKDKYQGTISCCSIHSPQAPISAAVSNHFNLPCEIYYGGTKEESLAKLDMPKLVRLHKGEIKIFPSGRHSILYSRARKNSEAENRFIISYGFNIIDYPELILGAVSNQVENIPDELDNLIITCGSGITTTGVLIGLKKFNKKVNKIIMVATAPSRKKMIEETLEKYNLDIEYEIIDLFHKKGFMYEKKEFAQLGDITLHPNYEAKTYNWLSRSNSGVNIHNNKNLFWIVGSEPKITECLPKI